MAASSNFFYYEVLQAYALGGDIQPFSVFIADLENKELDQMIEAIRQVSEQRGVQ